MQTTKLITTPDGPSYYGFSEQDIIAISKGAWGLNQCKITDLTITEIGGTDATQEGKEQSDHQSKYCG
jgi:hypothetical protein